MARRGKQRVQAGVRVLGWSGGEGPFRGWRCLYRFRTSPRYGNGARL